MTVAFVEQNLAEPHRPPRSTTAARSAGPFRASEPRRGGASTSLPGRPRRASHREPSAYRVARGASGTQSRSGERAVARGKRKCAKSAPPGGKPSLDVLADPRRARLARFLRRRIWIEISPFFIFDGLPRPRKAPIFLVRNQQKGFLYATDFSLSLAFRVASPCSHLRRSQLCGSRRPRGQGIGPGPCGASR
jgi:hypothetical protein